MQVTPTHVCSPFRVRHMLLSAGLCIPLTFRFSSIRFLGESYAHWRIVSVLQLSYWSCNRYTLGGTIPKVQTSFDYTGYHLLIRQWITEGGIIGDFICTPDPNGVSTFHIYEIRPVWVPSLLRRLGVNILLEPLRFLICRLPFWSGCLSLIPPIEPLRSLQRFTYRSPVRSSPRPVTTLGW